MSLFESKRPTNQHADTGTFSAATRYAIRTTNNESNNKSIKSTHFYAIK